MDFYQVNTKTKIFKNDIFKDQELKIRKPGAVFTKGLNLSHILVLNQSGTKFKICVAAKICHKLLFTKHILAKQKL